MPRTTRAYTQWTADTEIAFVMALRFHGHVGRALAEVGRTESPAYDRRRRSPEFAARWDDALDQWRRANAEARRAAKGLDAADVPAVVGHHDGWTAIRRRAFLRLIGEGESVTAACETLGLSFPGAYHLRDRDPAFAAAWDRAKGQSTGVLQQIAVERAVDGVEEQVWHAGKVVGTRRRYSEVLLRTLVTRDAAVPRKDRTKKELVAAAHAAAKLAGGSFVPKQVRTSEEVFASIAAKLDRVAAHNLRKEAVRAERWLAEGKIP
ncbi:hypothetical protein [Sphingomonas sp.]|jgi:hypothetical protein|uniref:hypothetical protein n=1 Tax=Sphingomonas sp. TaxID=28214 RepID=UPI002E37F1C4|nr:hypothetical protein [Sphingomonas sp.]HEX4695875.1 hypothetical protein [Sphingomonas sp.]